MTELIVPHTAVIPAIAGIQRRYSDKDTGFPLRGNDGLELRGNDGLGLRGNDGLGLRGNDGPRG